MGYRPSAVTMKSINVGVTYRRENEHEKENGNDRLRNIVYSNVHDDILDILERELTFCRGWPRGEFADCVTFYVVYINFTDFFDCSF
jgi:hypothetical protein